jgi:hypothetical protein
LSAATTSETAEQKIQLTNVIKGAMEDCKQAMSVNDRKKETEYNRASLAFEAEKRLLDMLKSHDDAQLVMRKQRAKLCKDMFGEPQFDAPLHKLEVEEYGLIDELATFDRGATGDVEDKRSNWYQEITEAYKEQQSVLEKQVESLERIAVIAEIDLKDVGRDGVVNFGSFGASEAVLLTRTASVIRSAPGSARGGAPGGGRDGIVARGSFGRGS